MNNAAFDNIVKRFETQDHLRIVVFGASNTERHMPTVHWSDVLEVGLRSRYGRKFQIINAGGSGNNTREALARFERDVLFYQPDIVIVTFGGNDCNISREKFVSETEFVENLTTIVNTLRERGTEVILQTYYKMIYEFIPPQRAAYFVRYMNAVRKLAGTLGCNFIDQYALFDKIDRNYRVFNLMRDPMHTNENGNMLIGLNVCRYFDVDFDRIGWKDKLIPMQQLLIKTLAE
ncbi:MAG: SGNH/GDSL hydrolase family protein [Lentisphaerae bacterium]|nr:SGNH/GDSL hydrolase family protein [Lentisphaerota bacterium]